MTDDNLPDYSDTDIIDTLAFTTDNLLAYVGDINNPLTNTEATPAALADVWNTLANISEGLHILQERRDAPQDSVLTAVKEAMTGRLSVEDLTHVLVLDSFRIEGAEPTAEQYQARLSEFQLIDSFIGRTSGE